MSLRQGRDCGDQFGKRGAQRHEYQRDDRLRHTNRFRDRDTVVDQKTGADRNRRRADDEQENLLPHVIGLFFSRKNKLQKMLEAFGVLMRFFLGFFRFRGCLSGRHIFLGLHDQKDHICHKTGQKDQAHPAGKLPGRV